MNNMPLLHHPRAADRPWGMPRVWPVFATLLLATGAALAQQTSPPAATDTSSAAEQEQRAGKGDATRAWLAAQGSRKQASATKQTLSGPVLSAVHQRYVKSFEQAVEPTPIRADAPATSR